MEKKEFDEYLKKQDTISQRFRTIHKTKGPRAFLADDILAAWKEDSTTRATLIRDLVGAFKFRHWFAHGRYWMPKLGRKYDYQSVYELALGVLTSFPFEETKAW